MIQLHSTLNEPSRKRTGKRVGRGDASGKGKSGGRGTKGQRSRAGGRRGMLRRSFKKTLQKMKKLRGFTSRAVRPETVSLTTLERVAVNGATITPVYLTKKGLVSHATDGVKIVGQGTLTKKINLKGCLASKTAVAAIEAKGGTVTF
jgi:large subunit ribosomal protein L15